MPKRSTTFQELIELLERQLAPSGSNVTSSKLLKDSRTGKEREVDIIIEIKSGIHPLTIGIEVIEHKRKATTPWIESIAKKHEDLPIHKSIAVSKSGFYQPALKKAEAYKIDTLTLEDVRNIDWNSKLASLHHITIGSFLVPQLTHASLIFQEDDSIEQFSDVNIGQLKLFNNLCESIGILKTYLDSFIKDPNFITSIEEKAFTDAGTVIDGYLHLPKDYYVLDKNDQKHKVSSIRFRAKCKKQEMKADLVKGLYRGLSVALASGKTFDKPVRIVLSEKEDDDNTQLSFRIINNE